MSTHLDGPHRDRRDGRLSRLVGENFTPSIARELSRENASSMERALPWSQSADSPRDSGRLLSSWPPTAHRVCLRAPSARGIIRSRNPTLESARTIGQRRKGALDGAAHAGLESAASRGCQALERDAGAGVEGEQRREPPPTRQHVAKRPQRSRTPRRTREGPQSRGGGHAQGFAHRAGFLQPLHRHQHLIHASVVVSSSRPVFAWSTSAQPAYDTPTKTRSPRAGTNRTPGRVPGFSGPRTLTP